MWGNMADSILVGGTADPVQLINLSLKRANRHGLVAGATGTGKTVTLQVLAEGFARAGVPVFAADVKGDLSGASQTWEPSDPFKKRAEMLGLADYHGEANPVVFWDLYGKSGHPIRTTVSAMGPTLLSRLMDVSDAQSGALTIAFKMADDKKKENENWNLLDLKDLKAVFDYMADNADTVSQEYGLVTKQAIAVLQRKVLELETAGADTFFGEPALDLNDFFRTDLSGRGIINILDGSKLMASPALYSTFLLWMMSELFEMLPEVGDPEKPKLVFFFDEAHLLFRDAPKALLTTIEQVVRLIRSKGVGIYFVTQNPQDIPETVLAQLGNRLQHALRAYTPSEMKAVKTAAESFRPNPSFSTEQAITELGVGEALVSTLDEKGVPTVVERTFIRPPLSRVGPATPDERARVIAASPIGTKYNTLLDRESAYETLNKKHDELLESQKQAQAQVQAQKAAKAQPEQQEEGGIGGFLSDILGGGGRKRRGDSLVEAAAKTMVRQASSSLTRSLVRGILGSLKR